MVVPYTEAIHGVFVGFDTLERKMVVKVEVEKVLFILEGLVRENVGNGFIRVFVPNEIRNSKKEGRIESIRTCL